MDDHFRPRASNFAMKENPKSAVLFPRREYNCFPNRNFKAELIIRLGSDFSLSAWFALVDASPYVSVLHLLMIVSTWHP